MANLTTLLLATLLPLALAILTPSQYEQLASTEAHLYEDTTLNTIPFLPDSGPASPQDLRTAVHEPGCRTVKTKFRFPKKRCDDHKKVVITVKFTIKIKPFVLKGTVTLRCLDKKKAKEVSKRTRNCLNVLLGRCKCLVESRVEDCVFNQLAICAGKNPVSPTFSPAAEIGMMP